MAKAVVCLALFSVEIGTASQQNVWSGCLSPDLLTVCIQDLHKSNAEEEKKMHLRRNF